MNITSPNISKLSNGLTLITYNMPYLKSAAISLIVKVGSRYESSSESGISHFFEHMAFKGTKKRSAKNIAEEFDAIGGNFNAYTSREHTVYHAKVLKEHTLAALDILSDILQNSVFDAEDITKEYEVIKQEIAQTQDNPDELVYENLYKIAFKDQPLGSSILGTEDTIADFNKEFFQQFLGYHYQANNIVLSIAGNIKHDSIQKHVQQLFAQMQSGIRENFKTATYCGGYYYHDKDLEQTNIALAFNSFSYLDLPKYYHTQILSLIFGGGISSRLFQHIREDLGLAYSVGSFSSSYYDTGLFGMYAGCSPEQLALLSNALINEIKKITDYISTTELDRAKAQIKSSILMAEEKSVYKAEEIGKNFAIFGEYRLAEEILEIIMNSTLNDITNTAKIIFSSTPTFSLVGRKSNSFDYENLADKLK